MARRTYEINSRFAYCRRRSPHQIAYRERGFHQREVFRNGEGGGLGNEKEEMKE